MSLSTVLWIALAWTEAAIIIALALAPIFKDDTD